MLKDEILKLNNEYKYLSTMKQAYTEFQNKIKLLEEELKKSWIEIKQKTSEIDNLK